MYKLEYLKRGKWRIKWFDDLKKLKVFINLKHIVDYNINNIRWLFI